MDRRLVSSGLATLDRSHLLFVEVNQLGFAKVRGVNEDYRMAKWTDTAKKYRCDLVRK